MRLSLNERHKLMKTYGGFRKGITWFWIWRILYPFTLLSTLTYQISYAAYGFDVNIIMTILWIGMIVLEIMRGYGLYSLKDQSHTYILIYYFAMPVLRIVYDQIFFIDNLGTFYMNAELLGQIIGSIISSAIIIYYFRNREMLFSTYYMNQLLEEKNAMPIVNEELDKQKKLADEINFLYQ